MLTTCAPPGMAPITFTVPPAPVFRAMGERMRGLGARIACGGVMANVARVDVPTGRPIEPATANGNVIFLIICVKLYVLNIEFN